MRRALAGVLGGLALALGPLPLSVAVTTSASAPPVIDVSGTGAFSPNGDGVKDVARIRYTLQRPGPVTIEVRPAHSELPPVYRTRLGRQSAGKHTWRWDGRAWHAQPVPDASYAVEVLSGSSSGRTGVQVDRRFRIRLSADPAYGAPRRDPVVVFPRSTVVRDHVGLVGEAVEREVKGGRIVVRDPRGQVVARASLRRQGTTRFATFAARLVWQARRPDGRPLPTGSYAVSVRGTDLAGNTATAKPFSVRVSQRRLEWRSESRTVLAVDNRVWECDRTMAMGCGLVVHCGVVVPSQLFVGGLSLRSAMCASPYDQSDASSVHRVTLPDAVRGIDSYRVALTGAPTVPGQTDPVTLVAGEAVLTTSGAVQTPWLTTGPYLDGDPWVSEFIGPLRPSVQWMVLTTGDDSFDVAAFTVDLRYLAVPRE